ncbi:MAG: AMP-binding protein, partial [Alphaproteobacteria bacterium]
MLLHHEIELQAARTPNAIAVTCADKSITYAELDMYANRCARYLRELGIGPDVIIGVLMERSLELVVGLLGILKAGGAYLPLDPRYPEERLNFILADADVPVVITLASLASRTDSFDGTVLTLDLEDGVLPEYNGSPLEGENTPDDLAYVIYTSG